MQSLENLFGKESGMDSETTTKGRRCLGVDCEELLPKGQYFCHQCEQKKDRTRILAAEQRGINFPERKGLVVRKKIKKA